jgi:transcriptional regulator with XRE-family HTH domain
MTHPVDIHVGGRIRAIRKAAGLSQEKLADHLGISFQQVQKYERGTNRISASKLFEAAGLLGVEISDFFAGLNAAGQVDGSTTPRQRASADVGLRRLVDLYEGLASEAERTRLVKAVQVIAAPLAREPAD